MARHPVTFMPSHRVAWIDAGDTVLAASRAAGVLIEAECGGRGVCGTCGIRVIEGALEVPDAAELAGLSRAPSGVRLACRARVIGPVVVRPLVAPERQSVELSGTHRGVELIAGVDLGTTNISSIVVESLTGREVGRATVPNPQRSFGGDVISRVTAALAGHSIELASSAAAGVATALSAASGGAPHGIKRVVIAGNTAMSALFSGTDVAPLATAPYSAPDVPQALSASAIEGLDSDAEVLIVPALASFVGGDVLAGLVSMDAAGARSPVLLIDVGTNAEVALFSKGKLTVTSAAAGPAFEGIAGMTGSEVVAAVARLVRDGVVDEEGLIRSDAAGVSVDDAGVRSVNVGEADERRISQLDIREVQLAKAAVSVAVQSVLDAAGVRARSLSHVWVAGAFGGALSADDVVEIGMVPAAVRAAVSAPGNTSAAGAVEIALSGGLGAARSYLVSVRHVELASDPEFAARLMRALRLAPHKH